jgi:hypothetical protein
MTDYYPLSIVVHGVALNITVQSHVDQLCFGLIACRRAVPDVHELGHQLQRAMATLRMLVAAAPALAAAETKAAAESAAAAADVAAAAVAATRKKRPRAARSPRLRVVPATVEAAAAAPAAKRKTRVAAAVR